MKKIDKLFLQFFNKLIYCYCLTQSAPHIEIQVSKPNSLLRFFFDSLRHYQILQYKCNVYILVYIFVYFLFYFTLLIGNS